MLTYLGSLIPIMNIESFLTLNMHNFKISEILLISRGQRSVDALAVFIEKQLVPGIQNFSSNAELNSLINVSYHHNVFQTFYFLHFCAMNVIFFL